MSQTKLLIIGAITAVGVLVLLIILVLGSFEGSGQKIDLTFWGVFDQSSFFESSINDFQRANPGVRITYRQFNFEDYEEELVNAFASGTGPDIWMMHNTWLPKHGDKIQPLPTQTKKPLFTLKEFQNQFVDVAASDLTSDGIIYSLPIYVDTLALYYNKDIFNSIGIASPPKTWDEFNDAVRRITVFDDRGNIFRSGAAIGTARNINRSTDILTLLMLQSGVQMTNGTNTQATFSRQVQGEDVGEVALRYFTDFADSSKSAYAWNNSQHFSIDAFVEGNVAMMFNYSHHVPTLRSKSPRLNFTAAPVPQISDTPIAVNYANYWAPTVSKQSKNTQEAWRFLVYLSSAEGVTRYLNASGRPAARRDLIEIQKNDLDTGVFAIQALSARSWYQVDSSTIENIFADMIESVNLNSSSSRDALRAAEDKVNVLMAKGRGW